MSSIKQSVMVRDKDRDNDILQLRTRRCYICVARAEILGPSHASFSELCRVFARDYKLGIHFVGKHLDPLAYDATTVCPICKVTLLHKKHLKNHSHRFHGVNTNWSWKRRESRSTH